MGRKRYRPKMGKVVSLAVSHDVVFSGSSWVRGRLVFLGCYIPNLFFVVPFVPAGLLVVFPLLFILGPGRGMVTAGA